MTPQGSIQPRFLLLNQVPSCYQLKNLDMNIQPRTARKSHLQMETLRQKDYQLRVKFRRQIICWWQSPLSFSKLYVPVNYPELWQGLIYFFFSMLDDHHWHTGMSPAKDDQVRGKETVVKICNRGNCNGLHKERILHNESGQTQKRCPERLNLFILGDIQNSTSALAAWSKLICVELEVGQGDLWRSLPIYMSLWFCRSDFVKFEEMLSYLLENLK